MPMHLDERRGHFVFDLAPTDHHKREVVAVDLGQVLHVQASGAHLYPAEARELAAALTWWADRKVGCCNEDCGQCLGSPDEKKDER